MGCGAERVDDSPLGINNLRIDAGWRATSWMSYTHWLTHHPDCHPLFLVISFFCLRFDVLHVFDLGVTSLILANVMFYASRSTMILDSGTISQKTDALWGHIEMLYKISGASGTVSTIGGLKESNFSDTHAPTSTFPALHGIKGAQARHLAPIMLHVLRQFARPDIEVEQHMLSCVTHLVAFYGVIDIHLGRYLSDEHIATVRSSVDLMMVHYNWLAHWAMREGVTM